MKADVVSWATVLLSLAAGASPAPAAEPTYPYTTTVNSDGVNVRSGPGEWWYVTGKLNRGARVKVIGAQFGWAQIEPPAGAGQFSLIEKKAVEMSGDIGLVKGDGPVAVYAGSSLDRRHNRVQLELAPGKKVFKVGEWESFYMIEPPAGAMLYISPRYLAEPGTAVAPAPETPRTAPPAIRAGVEASPPAERPPAVAPTPAARPAVAAPATQPETTPAALDRQRQLRATVLANFKALESESTKPLLERDYASLLPKFQEIKTAGEKENLPALATYADVIIQYIGRQMEVKSQLVSADALGRMEAIVARAEKLMSAPPVQPPPPGGYAAAGVLEMSAALSGFGAVRAMYKLVDASDKVACYCYPAEPGGDWANLLGQQVRIVGEATYKPEWRLNVVKVEQIETVTPVIPERAARQPSAGESSAGGGALPPTPPTPPTPPPAPTEDIFAPRFEGPPAPAAEPVAPASQEREPVAEPDQPSAPTATQPGEPIPDT